MDLQARYRRWHNEGMDLAFLLVEECKELLTKVRAVLQNDPDPQVRCERWVRFVDDDIFVSAWLDDQGRPCCWAKLDGDNDGMAWRVEFLDLHSKRALHQLLTATLSEVTASEGDA